MTQEDKYLLLKDLSARLPYGVMIQTPELFYPQRKVIEKLVTINDLWYFNDSGIYIENVKPYLRPMSSMTEEEKEIYHNLCYEEEKEEYEFGEWVTRVYYHNTVDSIDYLTSIHIDFRDLIKKGLALEAPEGMYDIKKK